MKRLRRMPRKYRDWIGGLVAFCGTVLSRLLTGSETAAMLMALPFVLFFVWLGPELWAGK